MRLGSYRYIVSLYSIFIVCVINCFAHSTILPETKQIHTKEIVSGLNQIFYFRYKAQKYLLWKIGGLYPNADSSRSNLVYITHGTSASELRCYYLDYLPPAILTVKFGQTFLPPSPFTHLCRNTVSLDYAHRWPWYVYNCPYLTPKPITYRAMQLLKFSCKLWERKREWGTNNLVCCGEFSATE